MAASDGVREAFEAWASHSGYSCDRAPSGVYYDADTRSAWAGYRAGKVAGMREAARECQRTAPFPPGRFDPDERLHERCADRCAAAIRALAAKEEA